MLEPPMGAEQAWLSDVTWQGVTGVDEKAGRRSDRERGSGEKEMEQRVFGQGKLAVLFSPSCHPLLSRPVRHLQPYATLTSTTMVSCLPPAAHTLVHPLECKTLVDLQRLNGCNTRLLCLIPFSIVVFLHVVEALS